MQHAPDRPRVAVIGGGLAGLAAARDLLRAGAAPFILEASDRVGGRVRQGQLAGETVELGAEFLHGTTSTAKRLADEVGLSVSRVFTAAHGDGGPDDAPPPDGGISLFYLGGPTLPANAADADLTRLNAALGRLSELDVDLQLPDVSLSEYLVAEGVSSAMVDLAAASYANALGAGGALAAMPLRAVARLERLWLVDGEGDYRLGAGGGSLGRLCAHLASGVEVCTGWPVARVEVCGGEESGGGGVGGGGMGGVLVVGASGATRRADAAVVAVPLPLLQSGALAFSPPLPRDKTAALRSIAVRGAVKLFLRLAGRPWGASPPLLHCVVCAGAGCVVPEVWLRRASDGEGWIVSGLATGDRADEISALPVDDAADLFLQQLALALPGAELAALRRSLRSVSVMDWAADPHTRGGYSTVSFDELPGARALYRRAEYGGRVAFAGEACEDAPMTMSAAIESGTRAAREVVGPCPSSRYNVSE